MKHKQLAGKTNVITGACSGAGRDAVFIAFLRIMDSRILFTYKKDEIKELQYKIADIGNLKKVAKYGHNKPIMVSEFF